VTKASRRSIRKAAPKMARRQLQRALKAVQAAAPPFGEDVHQARTALKRVRALLKLMRRGGKTRKRLADVARRVGNLRDADVIVTTFDRVMKTSGLPMTPALTDVRERLEAKRAALETDPRTAADLKEAQQILRRVKRRTKSRLHNRPSWPVIARGLVGSYRKARRALTAAYRKNTDAAFHGWRKAVKQHAYQLRALEAGGKSSRGRRTDLERLGDVLGEAQDLAMFEQTLQGERSCFPDENEYQRMLALMHHRRRQLRNEVRPLGEQLFSERPRDLARRLGRRRS
jgi:CHAD domain-containing protein